MLQHMHVQPVFHNMFEVKARPREDWNLSIQVKPGKRSHPVTALTMLSLIPQLKITDCHQNSIGFSVPGKNWIFAFQMLFSLSYHSTSAELRNSMKPAAIDACVAYYRLLSWLP